MIERVDRTELLLKQLAKILAANTNYATMVSTPQIGRNKIKFIQLSQMSDKQNCSGYSFRRRYSKE